MGKTLTFVIGAVIGLVAGGVLTFYLFVGAPQAVEKPGETVRELDAEAVQTGTAQIVLNEDFFNSVLQTIFRDMEDPTFPLKLSSNEGPAETDGAVRYAQQGGECDGKIRLLEKGSDVRTGVQFKDGKMTAPLAFSGSASVFGNCFQFNGWSQANLELRFDKEKQVVYGILNVETVNLDGISPIITNAVTPLIQGSLNQNVNPIEILSGKQVAVNLPIDATDGNLVANINDVRAEVKEKALHLFITYNFKGQTGR